MKSPYHRAGGGKLWPLAKSGPLPLLIHAILLEHSHAFSSAHCLWLISHDCGRVAREATWPAKLKIFIIRPFTGKVCDSTPWGKVIKKITIAVLLLVVKILDSVSVRLIEFLISPFPGPFCWLRAITASVWELRTSRLNHIHLPTLDRFWPTNMAASCDSLRLQPLAFSLSIPLSLCGLPAPSMVLNLSYIFNSLGEQCLGHTPNQLKQTLWGRSPAFGILDVPQVILMSSQAWAPLSYKELWQYLGAGCHGLLLPRWKNVGNCNKWLG